MECDILDSLEDLNYKEPLNEESLKIAIEDGLNSTEYSNLISWLSKEIQIICKLEEAVNPIKNQDDIGSFVLELNSFLKELGCPHSSLMQGQMKDRLPNYKSRALLLDYLCGELMAARITFTNCPNDTNMKLEMGESSTAKNLKSLLITLGFSKPPASITADQLFGKVESKINEIVANHTASVIGKPLFIGVLTQKQWHSFEKLQEQMHNEYKIRRELLIKRMDITIESFLWGEEAKKKAAEIAKVHNPQKESLNIEPNVFLSGVLSAREDLLQEEKTSSANVRQNTRSKINNVIIGRVPDRGGRPEDQQPPPPEMPSWQKRTEPSGGSGGFGGGRGGRGGRVQGNWSNQSDNTNFKGGWDKGNQQGGYQQSGYQQSSYDNQSGHHSQSTYNQHDDRHRSGRGVGRGGSRGRGGGGNPGGYYDAAGSYGSGSAGGYQGGRY